MKNLIKSIGLLLLVVSTFSCTEESANRDLGKKSIAEIVAVSPELSTLKEALDVTGLTSTLEEAGDYTVFVPNNDAFAAVLGSLTVVEFNDANPGVLANVLKYHVLTSRVLSKDLTDTQVVPTLLGQNLTVTLLPNAYYPQYDVDLGAYEQSSVFINDSRVVARDVECSNGIIHVIDSVLLPSS